jgi:signal transduction histidine kinase
MMSLQLALDELPKTTGPAESLTIAMSSARKAAELSVLMLTYLGQTVSKPERLDLSKTCRQSVALLRAALPSIVVSESDLPSPGPFIYGDANQIQHVLTNLVTNAWEAGDGVSGEIRLRVKTVPAEAIPIKYRFPIDFQPQEAAYACLEVADTGCGIHEPDIEKIFDPFFSSKHPGRGMGLAVVLGIARAHHWVVTLESEKGRGSVFRVFLPLAAAS